MRKGNLLGVALHVLIGVPLFLYLAIMAPFCILIGKRTTEKTGWLFAAGLMGIPLALYLGFMIAAAGS